MEKLIKFLLANPTCSIEFKPYKKIKDTIIITIEDLKNHYVISTVISKECLKSGVAGIPLELTLDKMFNSMTSNK